MVPLAIQERRIDSPVFGKHFASMYEGSMVGAGAVVFAVMGYVIANAKPDKTIGMQVELNPKLLSFILGESQQAIEKAIDKLCAPDPNSRSPEKEGRRLIKVGTFSYEVVNGAKYRAIRDEDARRRQNREAQARYRAKKSKPSPGLTSYTIANNAGASQKQLDNIEDDSSLRETAVPYGAGI